MTHTSIIKDKEIDIILRDKLDVTIVDLSTCYLCETTNLTENVHFCSTCGFPQNGTQIEKRNFLRKIKQKEKVLNEHKGSISKGTKTLFVVGGLNIVTGIIMGIFVNDDIALLLSCLILGGIYLILGFWSKKKPFPALISGFFLYVTILVISAILDPITILQGVIIKGIIIAAFVYAFKSVKDAERLEKELQIQKSNNIAE